MMEQRTLGASGLSVSWLGLGTFTWGHRTDREEAVAQLMSYVDAGGNLLDTADVYGGGQAEEIIGELLGRVVRRDDVVLATKAAAVVTEGVPQRPDASRNHILAALDASLRRLRTDYIDLWQLHAWDDTVPLDETMAAVEVALSSGRVRHAGVCNYSGEQTRRAAELLRVHETRPLASVQVEYSLLERGPERDVAPAALECNLGLLPWAPLGRGVLTGKYHDGVPERRANSPFFQQYVGHFLDARSAMIVNVVMAVAEDLGVSPLAVSLAWLRGRPAVVAPLVGARTAEQLRESLSATVASLVLPPEVVELLDKASQPDSTARSS